ncbi:hypothetical protein [Simkania sp.]|uniref:hypothetical protein n=1 Tax=Simkania sp. TaxID=34094 RepID=UPI003B51DE17
MESATPSSSSQKNSITNYFPPIKELAIRTATYGASSLLMGRANPVALTVSVFNAVTVSFATQFVTEDDQAVKKVIVAMVSLAAATFVATKAIPALAGRAALALTQDVVFKLALFNALGEAILFSVPYIANWDAPKLPAFPKDLDDLSEKNLLHMRHHFENFKAMTPVVFAAFVKKLETLDQEDLFPKVPKTVEDIQQLDAFGVRYAHAFPEIMNAQIVALEHELDFESDTDQKPLWEALYTRFIEQDLLLPLDDFDRHSKKTLLHIRFNFEDYRSMDSHTFEDFDGALEKLRQKDLYPKPPKTLEDIQKLDAFSVRYVFENLEDDMDQGILAIKPKKDQEPLWEALFDRFIEQKVPFKDGDFENMPKKHLLHIRNHFQDFAAMDRGAFLDLVHCLDPYIDEGVFPKPPQTLEDIRQLDAFAVRYANCYPGEMNSEIDLLEEPAPLYNGLHLRYFEHDLPLPGELTVRRIIDGERRFPSLKLDLRPSIEEVTEFSKNQFEWFFCYMRTSTDFEKYSLEEQVKLNELFLDRFNWRFFYLPKDIEEIRTLSDAPAKKLFDRFSTNIHEFIRHFTMAQKNAFNERFKTVEGYKEPLHTIYTPIKLEEIQKLEHGSSWHPYFVNNPEQWARLDKECQEAFNKVFTEGRYRYSPIAVTHSD